MVYLIGKIIIPPVIKFWIKEVNGLQNIPKKKTFILAANHASYMDHLIILSTIVPYLNKKIHHLAKKEHFDNIFKKALHTYGGAIPLDRQAGGKDALKWAIKSLKKGKVIGLHPEGTRSLTGKLQIGKTGIARLVLATGVPVIPVGLIGTFEILPKGNYFPKFKRAVMNIGKPMYFKKYSNKKITKKLLRTITTNIMKEIGKLCNKEYNF